MTPTNSSAQIAQRVATQLDEWFSDAAPGVIAEQAAPMIQAALDQHAREVKQRLAELEAEKAKSLSNRPAKGELRVEVMYSHGDWTEPFKFIRGYSLNAGTLELKRDMLREFCATLGEDFHDHISAAFFLVSSSEQKRREMSWGVERSETKAIITTRQENAALREQNRLAVEALETIAGFVDPNSSVHATATIALRTLKAQQGERLDGQPPHSLNNPAFIRNCAPSGAPDL